MLAAAVACLSMLGALQGPGPEGIPFESLGEALLAAADAEGSAGQALAAGAPAEQRFQERLAPLFERVELGALQLWLPLHEMRPDGELERARRPRAWKGVAEGLLALEQRWLEALGPPSAAEARELQRALASVRSSVRKATTRGRIRQSDKVLEAGLLVKQALLGSEREAHGLVVVLAPTRAQYVALLGASGLLWPRYQDELWTPAARLSGGRPICRSVLVLALTYGPRHPQDPWFEELAMGAGYVRQQSVHATSHLLSSVVLPRAPGWFREGLAIRDTTLLEGADGTLCDGHQGPDAKPFDDLPLVPRPLLATACLERSPYRGSGSGDLFADELRRARVEGGFLILDLDRARAALVAPGPFLGRAARVPQEVASGPPGVQEGFAEFYRAYCAAFPQWLSESEVRGTTLLDATLRGLVRRGPEGEARGGRGSAADLATVLHELTGRTLGESGDPERDLEPAFADWLGRRR